MSTKVMNYDVIIAGAGITGMYALHKLRKLGLSIHVLEARSGLGGTWYANRYPGCRFDSESVSYQFSFSDELIKEWDWSEEYAAQDETLRYLQFAAKKFDWEKDITFNSCIKTTVWDDTTEKWNLEIQSGERYQATYFIPCVGVLSSPALPQYDGIDSFKGEALHPIHWTPEFSEHIKSKRVAIIGTGATSVQIIPKIAPEVAHLTVLQRTANWSNPLRNSPISPEKMKQYHEYGAKESLDLCQNSPLGFVHEPDARLMSELSKEERLEKLEEMSDKPGFALWLGSFFDIFTDEESNKHISEFVFAKIDKRLSSLNLDPETHQALLPTDHGYGTRRVPLETKYYEAYARDNVTLKSIKADPIERITPKGIKFASGEEQEFDAIIYATGFDAFTGPFKRLNIVGKKGLKLEDYWNQGAKSYLGVGIHGFPNMLMPMGPLSGGLLCNYPRCIEENTNWVVKLIGYTLENGGARIEVNLNAETAWRETCDEVASEFLIAKSDSWLNGANIPGKPISSDYYAGGRINFREHMTKEATSGYKGFSLGTERPMEASAKITESV